MADYGDWGAGDEQPDETTTKDFQSLVQANVQQAAKIRQLQVALSAERRRIGIASKAEAENEMATRRFLDELAEHTGIQILYKNFAEESRTDLLRELKRQADISNSMLGMFLALPVSDVELINGTLNAGVQA